MKRIATLILLFTILPLAIVAKSRHQYEQSRTTERQFRVTANPTLNLNGKYSDVIVVNWDKSEIAVTAVVTVASNRESDIQPLLEAMKVTMSQSGNTVSVSNTFNNQNQQFKNVSFQVVYTIKIPKETRMGLINTYGHISLPELGAPLTVDLKYGNLKASGNINSTAVLNVKYGNINLENVTKRMNVDLKYGNMNTEHLDDLTITTSYCNVKVVSAKSISGYTKYDNYKIGSIGSLALTNSSYGSYVIGTLRDRLSLSDFRYSNIKVEKVESRFQSIDLPEAAYSDIKICIPSASFLANLSTKYGEIRLYDMRSDGSLSTPIGSHPTAKINISNKYGDIVIWK